MKNYTLKQFIKRLDSRTLKVEDCVKIKIDDQTYTVVCIAKDHDIQKDGSVAPYTFNIYELLENSMYINGRATNKGGWEKSNIRKKLAEFKSKLPKELADRIVPVVKRTSVGDYSTDIVETEDELFLFSEVEVFGNNEYSAFGEGKQYKFFEEWRNRFKHYVDRDWSSSWWLRSPGYNYSSYFVYVYSNGYANYNGASRTYGVSFGFCLK